MDIVDFGMPDADRVCVQLSDEHEAAFLESEAAKIAEMFHGDFCLRVITVDDWNRDLSPWEAPAVFGDEPFGGQGAAALKRVLSECTDRDKKYYIGGYSLAGLFALWAVYQSDVFTGAAAVSPSMWFPGFIDYMKEYEIWCNAVYLSLGDREEKTRNPVMATVGDKIREAESLLTDKGVRCTLEWNPGNHFREPDVRTAKGFCWVMGQE